jgi:hypothetical protein
MRWRRRLVPLFAAALVIQGLVALAPHEHGPAVVECAPLDGPGEVLTAVAAIHAQKSCFACSVHTPVVAPGPQVGPVWTPAPQPSIPTPHERSAHLSDVGGAEPRGPPRGF